MTTTQSSREIGTAAYVLTAVLAAFLLFLGLYGFLSPVAAARGFGIPLADPADAVYIAIKAGRDLGIGAMVIALLISGRRGPLFGLIAASVIIPLNDCAQVMATGRVGYGLAVHASAAAYGLVILWLLRRR
ncbi:MAG: DUF4267 domain-containing protein [Kofleriaceae bacterium]